MLPACDEAVAMKFQLSPDQRSKRARSSCLQTLATALKDADRQDKNGVPCYLSIDRLVCIHMAMGPAMHARSLPAVTRSVIM